MLLDENLVQDLVLSGTVCDTFRRLSAEKKSRLYQTAAILFGEYGYDGLAVDRFCREAGISKGSFFKYFPAKSHLLEFAVLILDNRLARRLADIKVSQPPAVARTRLIYLLEVLTDGSQWPRWERNFYCYLTGAAGHSSVIIEGVNLERHLLEFIADIIERGIQTREISRDLKPAAISRLVAIVVSAVLSDRLGEHREEPVAAAEHLISILFDGLAA
ncbi:MAG: TetR/AcrR family transcriptional regulator [bacterium]